ncbi:MAG: type II toxin-antitoxin system VapC family toxin [Candidatus Sigynarchaeota archaeon]
MTLFLDSDAIIAILRGKPSMAAFLASHKLDLFAIPAPVLFEIYYGFYYPPLSKEFRGNQRFLERLEGEQRRLQQFLNDIQVFELTIDAIKKAADLSARLDAAGMHVGEFDSLVAGIILNAGYTTIVTKNVAHYDKFPGLEVLNYE